LKKEAPQQQQQNQTMAYYQRPVCHSHPELIDALTANGVVQSQRVRDILLQVDRGFFSPTNPYTDNSQLIGYGVIISAPHMHVHALELLRDHLKEGARCLDVGSGSGYLTACMALMVGKTGYTVGIDHVPELVGMTVKNLNAWNPNVLKQPNIKVAVADGRQGFADEAPYDAIHTGAAVESIDDAMPLVNQLRVGGRLVIPLGPKGDQQFTTVDKLENGKVKATKRLGVCYVPLTDVASQLVQIP
jgi:protein-L-isoaspartate(D-aspartate) O-methyltransferase